MTVPRLKLEGRGGAVFLEVHAVPGAKRDGPRGLYGGALRLAVRAPAENGRANGAVIEAVARLVGARPSAVGIVSGHSARRKLLRIDGVPLEEVRRRVDEASG